MMVFLPFTEADSMDAPPPTATPEPHPSSPSPSSHQQHQQSGKVLATPAVRKMAAEQGIDLSRVVGSGKEGRVLKEDLLQHTEGEKGWHQPLVLFLHFIVFAEVLASEVDVVYPHELPGLFSPAFIS